MLAEITIAQVGVGIELQHDEVGVRGREWTDCTRRKGMLTTDDERKPTRRAYRLDEPGELVQGRLDRRGDDGLVK